MKYFCILIILLFCLNLYSESKPRIANNLIIAGGIVGGLEIINGVIQLFKKSDKEKENIEKEEEIKSLLSHSKLLSVLSTKSNLLLTYNQGTSNINNTNENITLKTGEEESAESVITNYEIKPVLRKGVVDYYEVGVAYYKVGKKSKAKECLLHTIAIGVREEEAIKFLMENFDMTRKEIQIEKRKYKELK